MARRLLLAAALLGSLVGLAGCTVEGPDDPGTWANPLPTATVARIGSYEIALGATDFDADALVEAADPAGAGPAEGRRYLLVGLELTYRGDRVAEPWANLDVRYVGRDGTLFGAWEADQCGAVPGSLEDTAQLQPGTTGWGTVCVSVPIDQIEGGTWIVRDGGQWGWHGFFAATADEPTVTGSFAAPHPVDAAFQVGSYTVSVGESDPDAFARVHAWDENAEPPSDDRTFVIAPVTLTFRGGTASGDPWSDLSFSYVAADGTVYGRAAADACGDIPEALLGLGVLTAQVERSGNVCVSVPADQVEGGRWHVAPEGTALVWTGFVATA